MKNPKYKFNDLLFNGKEIRCRNLNQHPIYKLMFQIITLLSIYQPKANWKTAIRSKCLNRMTSLWQMCSQNVSPKNANDLRQYVPVHEIAGLCLYSVVKVI